MSQTTTYIGNELELFDHAHNWKNYWGDQVKPYLGERVLEVGAGMGGTTKHLIGHPVVKKWVCLEPDGRLSSQIASLVAGQPGAEKVTVETMFLADYPADQKFDTILYIDVIEHIEQDAQELERASSYLAPSGSLVIVVPAHNFLFSPFDKAIGHFRRYDKPMLKKVLPASLSLTRLSYLDSLGLCASLANKLFLKQQYPTLPQIKFWDSTIVPVSRVLDKLVGFSLGKSLLLVAQKK